MREIAIEKLTSEIAPARITITGSHCIFLVSRAPLANAALSLDRCSLSGFQTRESAPQDIKLEMPSAVTPSFN
jgi:hypothetical protein